MTKTKTTPIQYVVLVPCGNDRTGKTYEPGDVVTTADFDQDTINNWLAIDPPVLAIKGGDSGSNS